MRSLLRLHHNGDISATGLFLAGELMVVLVLIAIGVSA